MMSSARNYSTLDGTYLQQNIGKTVHFEGFLSASNTKRSLIHQLFANIRVVHNKL